MEVLFQLDKNIETYFHCTVIINWQKHLELIAFILQKKRNETEENCFEGLEKRGFKLFTSTV
jgi:hypothetical protein